MRPGEVVAGCQLERAIGAGAMGVVFLARRPDGSQAVVKFLETVMTDPNLRARFGREASALARLPPHPTLVRIFDVLPDHDPPCMIMEFVPGDTLGQRLRSGPFEPREAARLARDVAAGLTMVHSHGLLHRDLKPANVLLTPAGQVRVIDFGLVKDVFATALTEPGQLLGTGPYMAPECWGGSPEPHPRLDVFSLGVILYQTLTGALPFKGRDLESIGAAIVGGEYPPLRQLAPAVPAELEDVVAMMLAASPQRRYASLRAVRDDLEHFLGGEAPDTPRLETADGKQRWSLLGKRRLVIGSDPKAELQIGHRSVAPQHAQLRVKGDAWELRDLNSKGGIYQGGQRVKRSCKLADGDELRFGRVTLRFWDPRARDAAAPFLEAPSRVPAPAEQVFLLARMADPRAAATLIEWALPDPGFPDEILAGAALAPDARPAIRAALVQELGRLRQGALASLTRLAGGAPRAGWLAWWAQARTQLPPQWTFAAPWRDLRVTSDEAGWEAERLGTDDVFLVGRDPRCHVRLRNRTVSRLHATLLRLHRRIVVRDEGRATPAEVNGARVPGLAVLEPGDTLSLGDVHVRLEHVPAAPSAEVHPLLVRVLVAGRHPAACAAAIAELTSSEPPSTITARLFPDARAAAEATEHLTAARAARTEQARELLSAVLGGSRTDPTTAFQQRFSTRQGSLPTQLLSPRPSA